MNVNQAIMDSPMAMDSARAVCVKAGFDVSAMTDDAIVNESRKIAAPCNHDYDRPYAGHGTRVCRKCGGLQTNG